MSGLVVTPRRPAVRPRVSAVGPPAHRLEVTAMGQDDMPEVTTDTNVPSGPSRSVPPGPEHDDDRDREGHESDDRGRNLDHSRV